MLVMPKLYAQPIVNVPVVQEWTGFSRPGSQEVINRFIKMNILSPKDKDITYGQSYIYREYLNVLPKENKCMNEAEFLGFFRG